MKRAIHYIKRQTQALGFTMFMVFTAISFNSCVIVDDDPLFLDNNTISLAQLLETNELWYVDYHATQGPGNVRFMSLAFTLSFRNGNLFANNNLVGIGAVGNGFGDQIGYYNTRGNVVEIDHDLDGFIDMEVIQIGTNRIQFRDHFTNVTYSLIGYNRNEFDYDQVFYDNIEYFLQEYVAWKKTGTFNGVENEFDNENFLAFIPEQVNTFRSSQDNLGTNVDNLLWDFSGEYEVFDVLGHNNLKILTLDYDLYGNEMFELSVIDDGTISLYHNSSDTTYEFEGRGQIIFKQLAQGSGKDRARFKVKRKTMEKPVRVKKISNR